MFDGLWRMRFKSNYGTIDPYLVARLPENDHTRLNSVLCTTTEVTVGLLKLYIFRRIGKNDYGQIASDFIKAEQRRPVREDAPGPIERGRHQALAGTWRPPAGTNTTPSGSPAHAAGRPREPKGRKHTEVRLPTVQKLLELGWSDGQLQWD